MDNFEFVAPLNSYLNTAYVQTEHVNKIRMVKERRTIRRQCHSHILSTDHLLEKLKIAINAKDVKKVEELIQDGAPILKADEKNRTLLHIAAAAGNSQIVSILLEHGADPDAKDIVGNTPLHLATCIGNISVVTILLKNGTKISTPDGSGRSALMMANSRLKMLRVRSSEFKISQQLKEETLQLMDLLKVYLLKSEGGSDELDSISDQLGKISTREQILEIGNIMEKFTALKLSNYEKTKN